MGISVWAIVVEGTITDCSRTGALIEGMDADAILARCMEWEMEPVIPPRCYRRHARSITDIRIDRGIWWKMPPAFQAPTGHRHPPGMPGGPTPFSLPSTSGASFSGVLSCDDSIQQV